jgi:hypothetical protein
MSQWGKPRTFKGERSSVTIVPHVHGPMWAALALEHTIDAFIETRIDGDKLEAAALYAGVRMVYENKPYSMWLRES